MYYAHIHLNNLKVTIVYCMCTKTIAIATAALTQLLILCSILQAQALASFPSLACSILQATGSWVRA